MCNGTWIVKVDFGKIGWMLKKKVQHIILQQSVQTAEDIYAQERNCFHNTHDSAKT